MNFEEFLKFQPYELNKEEKAALLTARLLKLTEDHQKNCAAYSRDIRLHGRKIRSKNRVFGQPKIQYDATHFEDIGV